MPLFGSHVQGFRSRGILDDTLIATNDHYLWHFMSIVWHRFWKMSTCELKKDNPGRSTLRVSSLSHDCSMADVNLPLTYPLNCQWAQRRKKLIVWSHSLSEFSSSRSSSQRRSRREYQNAVLFKMRISSICSTCVLWKPMLKLISLQQRAFESYGWDFPQPSFQGGLTKWLLLKSFENLHGTSLGRMKSSRST